MGCGPVKVYTSRQKSIFWFGTVIPKLLQSLQPTIGCTHVAKEVLIPTPPIGTKQQGQLRRGFWVGITMPQNARLKN
jgi:hypothetical protein